MYSLFFFLSVFFLVLVEAVRESPTKKKKANVSLIASAIDFTLSSAVSNPRNGAWVPKSKLVQCGACSDWGTWVSPYCICTYTYIRVRKHLYSLQSKATDYLLCLAHIFTSFLVLAKNYFFQFLMFFGCCHHNQYYY